MSTHQSVTDYLAARQAGDDARCREILDEVTKRIDRDGVDGAEMAALLHAIRTVPLAGRGE